jgi:hypothetical protein
VLEKRSYFSLPAAQKLCSSAYHRAEALWKDQPMTKTSSAVHSRNLQAASSRFGGRS